MPARKRPVPGGARRPARRKAPPAAAAPAAGILELTCPKCGAAQPGAKVTTVLRPADEAGLAALLKGTLNVFTCVKCGTPFRLDSPVLYRDDARRALIYWAPNETQETLDKAEKQVAELLKALMPAAAVEAEETDNTEETDGTEEAAETAGVAPDVTCRLTLTRGQFIEKVMLWRNELDDRVVEYIKFQLFQNPQGHLDPVRTELFYDFSQPDPANLSFLVIDRESGQAAAGTHVPMELYAEAAATFLSDTALRAELDKLFPGYHVSVSRLL